MQEAVAQVAEQEVAQAQQEPHCEVLRFLTLEITLAFSPQQPQKTATEGVAHCKVLWFRLDNAIPNAVWHHITPKCDKS